MVARLSNAGRRRGARWLVPVLLIFASWLPMAAAQRSSDEIAVKKDSILRALDRVCREEMTQSLAGAAEDRPPVVADFLTRVQDPDAVCTCSVRDMRAALDAERIDPFDRPTIAEVASSTIDRCMQESLVGHFRTYCDALMVNFYGEPVLQGPHGPAIADFCECTRTGLSRIPPERFRASMRQSDEAIQRYRDEGVLEDGLDGSMASVMARCGIVELKQTLIDAMEHPAAR